MWCEKQAQISVLQRHSNTANEEETIKNQIKKQNDRVLAVSPKVSLGKALAICLSSTAGVGKLFVRRATFEKNVAAEGRTLSLQNRKVYSLCKKTHIHIKHSFFISHSGALGRHAPG